MAVNHDWVMEEAWALYLEGSHFLRRGVEYEYLCILIYFAYLFL